MPYFKNLAIISSTMPRKVLAVIGLWGGLVLALAAVGVIIGLVASAPRPVNNLVDMSWPNCSRLPAMQFSSAIIGATGGLDFYPNPCAGNEARLAGNYSVYLNSGDPGFPIIKQKGGAPLNCRGRDLVCYSFNYGYQSALYALRQANLADLHSAQWWIDVEVINSWTPDKNANREDIVGMLAALGTLKLLPPAVGIYTAVNQWHSVVGNWRVDLPLWLGTGDTNAQSAARSCRSQSVTGVPVVLTQYTLHNLDYDYRCRAYSVPAFF